MANAYPLIDRSPVNGDDLRPRIWPFVSGLADEFPGAFVLVGGQMVLLLGLERGQLSRRESYDVDALVSVKVLPKGTLRLSRYLQSKGLELAGIDRDGVGHRFEGNGLAVDVLAPDNLGPRADLTTIGTAHTVQVPAGARLLSSPRRCPVEVNGEVFAIPRPDLDAAIVGKAAALTLPDAERHGEDLAFLLGLVDDVRWFAEAMSTSDLGWLRNARPLLDDERVWNYSHDPQAARAALDYVLRE